MEADLSLVGKKIVCKCGREGIVKITRMRKGREYIYLVVRHYSENRYCIIKRISADLSRIENVEEILRLVRELEEQRKELKVLREENDKLTKENIELRFEKKHLEKQLEFFKDVWKRSIVVRRDDIEEKLRKIKELVEEYDGVRIIPFRIKVVETIEYG